MFGRKKKLSYEELIKKEKEELEKLKKQAELEKLKLEKEQLKKQARQLKSKRYKESLKTAGKVLDTIFKGVPALDVDLKPINKKKK